MPLFKALTFVVTLLFIGCAAVEVGAGGKGCRPGNMSRPLANFVHVPKAAGGAVYVTLSEVACELQGCGDCCSVASISNKV